MRCIIFISCLILYHQVHASSDWLNRTVRVDLVVDREASHDQYVFLEQPSPRIIFSGDDATNGQYPWVILAVALTTQNTAIACSGTIISESFFLSDNVCVTQERLGEVHSIEIYVGSAQWNRWTLPSDPPTHFVRHYWYIRPSPENRPTILLGQPHEPLTFNPNIQPIRLPYAANANFSYEAWSSLIVGYRLSTINQLIFVPSKIFNNNQCDLNGGIADYELCGYVNDENSFNGTGTHFGIAGGAWMVYEYAPDLDLHPVLIGIYHYHSGNGIDTPGVGTRVSPFLEWIETLTGGLFK